jgi:hypothetical protein
MKKKKKKDGKKKDEGKKRNGPARLHSPDPHLTVAAQPVLPSFTLSLWLQHGKKKKFEEQR